MDKTLRASGGDFTTLQDAFDWIITNGPWSENINLLVERGGDFGSDTGSHDFFPEANTLAGFTLTIKPDATTSGAIPILRGQIRVHHSYTGPDITLTGKIVVEKLKWAQEQSGVGYGHFTFEDEDSLDTLTGEINNCILWQKIGTGSAGRALARAWNAGTGVVVKHCSIMMETIEDTGNYYIYFGNQLDKCITYNSQIFSTAPASIQYFDDNNGNRSNNVWNFSGSGITFEVGIDSSITNLNPFFETANPTSDPFAADLRLTDDSTVNDADPTKTLSDDIVGTVRPQETVSDRGAYEFTPLTPPSADFTLSTGMMIRDNTKFSSALDNYTERSSVDRKLNV